MPDYRAMYDRDYLGVWDLNGRDVVVTIASVSAGELISEGNKKSRKPILTFTGRKKKLVVNVTNGKILKKLFGTVETEKWVGQSITLFATTTNFGKDIVDCIRIRPTVPQRGTQQGQPPQQGEPEPSR